jgi:hypothetical protein
LPLNYNEFHVLSATPRDMECDMKKLPDKAEIVKWIVTALGHPLRQPRSEAEASAAVERMIETLRVGYRHPRPDAAFIRKAAKNFRKALEPLCDAMPLPPLVANTLMEWILVCPNGEPVFIESCDQKHMTLREFRSALDWFESTDGPSPKFDAAKYCAGIFAYRLVNEFSQKPPSTALGGQVRNISTLLYQAFSGEEDVELKRQTDAVCRNRRTLPDNGRLRRFIRKEGKLLEAYLDEAPAAPGAREE